MGSGREKEGVGWEMGDNGVGDGRTKLTLYGGRWDMVGILGYETQWGGKWEIVSPSTPSVIGIWVFPFIGVHSSIDHC